MSSNECVAKDRNRDARTIRCERDSNAEVVAKISAIPGAIGYADAPSVAEARKSNALTLDNRVFDTRAASSRTIPFGRSSTSTPEGSPSRARCRRRS
ncbi:hypothetical protein [Actinokineospora iranica]|uniref:Uncharacterized protein n=1 Tax=Actinokineospora iranica TaxID=1271860 RepID=A0A1G6MBX1_9PSEU|nr:hypothetical protein [Actinokineospora iranica]SDC52807.1 hypothetical protein SAMN05216174_102465 [Actinokineospora iranica]